MANRNSIFKDIKCGYHSGFHFCCILFYLIRGFFVKKYNLYPSYVILFDAQRKVMGERIILPEKVLPRHWYSINAHYRNLLAYLCNWYHYYKKDKGLHSVGYIICPLCTVFKRKVIPKLCPPDCLKAVSKRKKNA